MPYVLKQLAGGVLIILTGRVGKEGNSIKAKSKDTGKFGRRV